MARKKERAFSIRENVYKEWCLEFFSTMYFERKVDCSKIMKEKCVWFRLCGREHAYMFLEFAVILGMKEASDICGGHYVIKIAKMLEYHTNVELGKCLEAVISETWDAKMFGAWHDFGAPGGSSTVLSSRYEVGGSSRCAYRGEDESMDGEDMDNELHRQNRRVPFKQRNEPPTQSKVVYASIHDINYFHHFLDILKNYNPMDEEPMWVADRVVAPTPSFAITIPETANEFAIKGNHLNLIKGNQFDGRIKTDAHKHIQEFLGICDMFKYRDTKNEAACLMMFPLSLTGEAKTWLDELNEGTIETWDELRTSFIRQFFPQLYSTDFSEKSEFFLNMKMKS
nr:reverse transcriptase domain-containing protein [Tanacetum cinerariifolium]